MVGGLAGRLEVVDERDCRPVGWAGSWDSWLVVVEGRVSNIVCFHLWLEENL